MITVTVNSLPISQYVKSQQRTMEVNGEEHQRRIVRSTQRIIVKSVRNHSGARSGKCRTLFHAN